MKSFSLFLKNVANGVAAARPKKRPPPRPQRKSPQNYWTTSSIKQKRNLTFTGFRLPISRFVHRFKDAVISA